MGRGTPSEVDTGGDPGGNTGVPKLTGQGDGGALPSGGVPGHLGGRPACGSPLTDTSVRACKPDVSGRPVRVPAVDALTQRVHRSPGCVNSWGQRDLLILGQWVAEVCELLCHRLEPKGSAVPAD